MRTISLVALILLLPNIVCAKIKIKEYDPLQIEARSFFQEGLKLYQRFKFEESIVCYKKALDLKPEFTEVWYWIGKSYYRDGLIDQAVSSWQRFLSLGGDKRHKDLQRKIRIYTQPELGDTTIYQSLATYSGTATGESAFSQPIGVVIDKRDNLYLLNFGSHDILKFSTVGDFLGRIGKKDKKIGQLNQPFGIALDNAGNIYVTDWGNNRVQKFSPEGKCLLVFGEQGKTNGKFNGPEGIAIGKGGIIYVVDNGNSRIQCFNKNGKFLSQIGQIGHKSKELFYPVGITVDNKEDIWVTDTGNKSLKRFSTSGNFKEEFAFPEKKAEARGITFGTDLNIYVTFSNGHIWRFNPQEKFMSNLKTNKAFFNLIGITMNRHGVIYVSDFDNANVEALIPDGFAQRCFDLTIEKMDTTQFPQITYQVRVTTKNGKDVFGLTDKNFKVIENKRQILPVIISNPLLESNNLLISFMLDSSEGMNRYKRDVRKLIYQFVKDFRPESQSVSLTGVAEKVSLIKDSIRNKTQLRDIIDDYEYKGKIDEQALFSSLISNTQDLLNFVSKKVIVFLSHGQEVSTGTLFKRAAYMARNNHIPIFVIDFRREGKTESLSRLAQITGGKYILAHNSSLAERLYQTITQYTDYQYPYMITYKSLEWQWPNRLTNVEIQSGYRNLIASDLGDYLVPSDKGISSEKAKEHAQIFEAKKITEMIKEYEPIRKWKEKLQLKTDEEKKASEGGEHGEGAPKKKARPPIEERIEPNIGSPVRPKPGSEDAKPKSAEHGEGH